MLLLTQPLVVMAVVAVGLLWAVDGCCGWLLFECFGMDGGVGRDLMRMPIGAARGGCAGQRMLLAAWPGLEP